MNKIRYYFSSKKLLMAQAEDLQRQLQEAWDKVAILRDVNETVAMEREYIRDQLHRVARERDGWKKGCQDRHDEIGKYMKMLEEERRLRLAAEKKHRDIVWAWSDKQIAAAAEELRDTYLENEEE